MIDDLAQWKAALIAALFVLFFVAERIFAAAPSVPSPRRLIKNGALWLLNTLMSPALVLPLTLIAAEHPLWERPLWLAGAAGLVFSLVLLDLWTYWLHRAYHVVPVMWRLHEVHHLDQRLDATSAVRFHFAEVLLSALLRMVPIVLLAIPFLHVLVFETLLLAGALFHHSNVKLPAPVERALSKVIVTPSIHWVHHHATARDTNSNYAAILSLWDPLFRSRSATVRDPNMAIGVEGMDDKGLMGLLLRPAMRRNA